MIIQSMAFNVSIYCFFLYSRRKQELMLKHQLQGNCNNLHKHSFYHSELKLNMYSFMHLLLQSQSSPLKFQCSMGNLSRDLSKKVIGLLDPAVTYTRKSKTGNSLTGLCRIFGGLFFICWGFLALHMFWFLSRIMAIFLQILETLLLLYVASVRDSKLIYSYFTSV